MTDRQYILCDLDHTLSNAFHRDDMIGKVEWDEYHSLAHKDEPLWDIFNTLCYLADDDGFGYKVVGLTARPEKWRAATVEWCAKHGLVLHDLLMRPHDNFDSSPELKVYLAQCYFEGAVADHVKFVIDDREDVIAAFKALGVTGLVVHGRRD